MSVKLLTEHHFGFLSLKGGFTGSSEPTLVKMPHCWKSHVMARFYHLTRARTLNCILEYHSGFPWTKEDCAFVNTL